MQGDILYLGLPIVLFVISLGSYLFVGIEIKKRRLDIKDIGFWIFFNSIFTIVVTYITIISIVQHFKPNVDNWFNWLARRGFGLRLHNQEWIILMILCLIAFILTILMINTVRIQKLNRKLSDMAKEVAILNGKVNKSANNLDFNLARNNVTAKDVKKDLREKVKIAKAEKKAKQKLKLLTQTQDIKMDEKNTDK